VGGYCRLAASLSANSEDCVASLERWLAEQELSKVGVQGLNRMLS
jgi:hypothetical protein